MTPNRHFYLIVIAGLALAPFTVTSVAEQCKNLQGSTPQELTMFLEAAVPTLDDPTCITFALKSLGDQRYKPAIEAAAKLLDFRRPKTVEEKQGIYVRVQGIDELYPAAYALELIGKDALPALLEVIKSPSSSQLARENAVAVWMEIQRGDSPKAVAALVRDAQKTENPVFKHNLEWAAAKGATWCSPPDETACKAALMNQPTSPDAPQK